MLLKPEKFSLLYGLLLMALGTAKAAYSSSYDPGYSGGGARAGIPIGLISDGNADILRKTFEHAIAEANTDLSIPLEGQQEVIQYGDSLRGYKFLCNFMENGVGAVFGPSAKKTAAHLMSICDSKDIPYIYSHMSESVEGFNLYPHPMDIARILHNIIDEFGWKRLIFLYESSEFLSIFNGLMSFYDESGPVIRIMRYDLNLNGNYKPVLRRLRKTKETQIIVMGSTNSVDQVLRQATQVGIMNEDYSYIIGNLDFHTFDLEEYKYSEANITGLRMFSTEQPEIQKLIEVLSYDESETEKIRSGACPITLEMALMYDAVQVFAEATKHLAYTPQKINCSHRSDTVQEDGSTLRNYMRSLDVREKTLTGRIYFEGNTRKGYTLDVIELQSDGVTKVGTWNEHENLTIQRRPQPINYNVDPEAMINTTFKVLISTPNPPYARLVKTHLQLTGNDRYEGYGIDLIKELAAKLVFNFTFIEGSSDYGGFNTSTNVSTGMMKELREGKGDLAISDLTITAEREAAVDFTVPFMNLGISILYIKPTVAPPKLFSFMDPFSSDVWFYLGLAYAGVSMCFFILGRLSPLEWDNPYPCIEEPEELENQFNLSNAIWFTTGAVLQQGTELAPKGLSTRTAASIWWFFTLIIVSSYTANLAAFLTIENPTPLFTSVDALGTPEPVVKFGSKKGGATRNFFATQEEPVYQAMNQYMLAHPELLVDDNDQGVDKVRLNTDYAFLMESTTIEYNSNLYCNLEKIGDTLDEKGYGIAMRKNSPFRNTFNNALLELQEQGVLAKLKNKWWYEVSGTSCGEDSGGGGAKQLSLLHLGGVYLVWGIGSIVSMVFGLTAWCRYIARNAKYYDVPFKAAFVEEFKAVIQFGNNERVLKSATSIYSRSRNSSMSIDSIETDSERAMEDKEF